MSEIFSLVEAENEYMKNKPNFSLRRPAIYPSEASVSYFKDGVKITKGNCLRASYYRISEYKKDRPDSPGLSMKAKIGKACEGITINHIKEMGLFKQNNVKYWNPEFVISGELDWIWENPLNKNLVGTEQKTYHGPKAEKTILGYAGTKGSKNVPPKPPIPGQPKTNQFLQAINYEHYYCKTLKWLQEYRMYYMDRGNGTRVEFLIGTELSNGKHLCWHEQVSGPYWRYYSPGKIYYPFTLEDIQNRSKQLAEYVRRKELPPKDYSEYYSDEEIPIMYEEGEIASTYYEKWFKNPSKYPISRWNCSYCDYSEQCKRDS